MVTALAQVSEHRTRLTGLLGLLLKPDIFPTPSLGAAKTAEKASKKEDVEVKGGLITGGSNHQPACQSALSRVIIWLMEAASPPVRDFILFCACRCGSQWPTLYDEMCRVAGRRLFRGMGYQELSRLGLSFSLNDIEDTIKMVDSVISLPPEPSS